MGLFSKIGELIGGGATAPIKAISDIVGKWVPDVETRNNLEKELGEQYQAATASARAHDTPMQSGDNPVAQIFDSLVNGVNRLIRPTITIGLFGGIIGWWNLPKLDNVDPMILVYGETVLLFWFGGRALFKDLPAMLKYLKKR